jgi:D-alanine-D-alanine ligase
LGEADVKITVLLGGSSEERDVSLSSGSAVARALRSAGHEVVSWDTLRGPITPEREQEILDRGIGQAPPAHLEKDIVERGDLGPMLGAEEVEGTDLFFPVLHGGAGEDGRLQTLLELRGVPYAGSDRVGCLLAMDKEVSKSLFRDSGIPTPEWVALDTGLHGVDRAVEAAGTHADRLGYPLIVKPPSGGSTVGLSLVHDPSELEPAVRNAAALESRVLMEAYVEGRELTVGILDQEALAVGEIIPEHELFDYECKYQPGLAQEIFPADIPAEVEARVQQVGLAVHRTLRLADFSRVDFILDGEGTPWVLEANTLPGMSPSSLLPKSGRAAGYPFPDLCDRIARVALARNSA